MTPLSALADPLLPGLGDLRARPGAARGAVLAHKAGRRATLLLDDDGRLVITKLFSPGEFGAALEVTRASARHAGIAPGLLAVDEDACTLELEVVAGTALDRVDPAVRDRAVPRLAPVLAAVHAAPADGLHAWDPAHPGRKLRRWYEAAREVAPEVTEPLTGVVDRLAGPVPAGTHPAVCVHGDLSLRNVVLDEATGVLRLVDWDRMSAGPAEVDLAPLVGLLAGRSGPGRDLLDGYRATGRAVDTALLARLVLVNRVTRILRRVHRGADGPQSASRRLRALLHADPLGEDVGEGGGLRPGR